MTLRVILGEQFRKMSNNLGKCKQGVLNKHDIEITLYLNRNDCWRQCSLCWNSCRSGSDQVWPLHHWIFFLNTRKLLLEPRESSLPVLKWTIFLVRMTSDGSLPVDKRRNYSSVFNAIARIYKVTCREESHAVLIILFLGRGSHYSLEGGHTYYG